MSERTTMAVIDGTPELSVSIPPIDSHRVELVRVITELHEAMRVGRGNDGLGRILRRLMAYTQTHFEYEEAAMQRAGYPAAVTHQAMHRQLPNKVRTLSADLTAGRSILSMELLESLRSSLKEHILKTDKTYSSHLLSHGVR